VFDILIKNGIVYDGTGSDGEKLDVAINGGSIVAIGHLEPAEAKQVIDASGKAVAPGFIDCHSHSDLSAITNPLAESKVFQGVTTEIVGNCGVSAAPFHTEVLNGFLADFSDQLESKPSWHSLDDYFELVSKRGTSVNIASLIGHGNVRLLVVGLDEGLATPEQLRRMRQLIEQCVEQGAVGLSTGLIYPPGMYADTNELVECARALKTAHGIYASHIRSEGDKLIEAICETIEIGRRAEVPVHISHLKTSGKANWSKLDRVFEEIEQARNEGVRVTCDRYPYIAGATWLAAVLPDWAQAGGRDLILDRLRDVSRRARIQTELEQANPAGDRWYRVMVTSVKDRVGEDFEGLTVAEIAGMRGVEPAAAVVDLLIETDLGAGAIMFSMCEENMRRILKKPYVMIGSDAWAIRVDDERGKVHPRAYGTFPRVLGRLVREGLFSLAEAVHKMTGMPAETFRLAKRGFLREGCFADVVVFDPDRIMDPATYEKPNQYPAGIECAIVNGRVTVQNGSHTGARAGRVLRGT